VAQVCQVVLPGESIVEPSTKVGQLSSVSLGNQRGDATGGSHRRRLMREAIDLQRGDDGTGDRGRRSWTPPW
jgi:hypothetical protein